MGQHQRFYELQRRDRPFIGLLRWLPAGALALVLAALSPAAAEKVPDESLPMRRHEALRMELTRALRIDSQAKDGTAGPDHPLAEVLRYAHEQFGNAAAGVRDYRCTLIKRERVGGRLQEYRAMDLTIRNPRVSDAGAEVPFGVYLKFTYPAGTKGREALYVAGKNHGNLLATKGGNGLLRDVTRSLSPESPQLKEGTNYPVTEIGILNLFERLIEDGIQHVTIDSRRECQVIRSDDGKINNRPCHVIQVTFPRHREGIRFHRAQIFFDPALGVPVRYAAYSWPPSPGAPAPLLEEFTYVNVKLNVGLTDRDFDRENPMYGFYNQDER